MNEDGCERVAEEYKVKSSVTKESGTTGDTEQRTRDNIQNWLKEFIQGNLWDLSLCSTI